MTKKIDAYSKLRHSLRGPGFDDVITSGAPNLGDEIATFSQLVTAQKEKRLQEILEPLIRGLLAICVKRL
jgi:hypothetical protein